MSERLLDWYDDHGLKGIFAIVAVGALIFGGTYAGYAAGLGNANKTLTRTTTSLVTVTGLGGNTTTTETTYLQPELLISSTTVNGTETTYTTSTTITWTNTTTITEP